MRILLSNRVTGRTTWVQSNSVAGAYKDMLSGSTAYFVAHAAIRRALVRLGGAIQYAVDTSGKDVVICPLHYPPTHQGAHL
jgi:hypothetical protein